MITIDEYVVSRITSSKHNNKKYYEYFTPEIEEFLTDEFIQKHKNEKTLLANHFYILRDNFKDPTKNENKQDEGYFSAEMYATDNLFYASFKTK